MPFRLQKESGWFSIPYEIRDTIYNLYESQKTKEQEAYIFFDNNAPHSIYTTRRCFRCEKKVLLSNLKNVVIKKEDENEEGDIWDITRLRYCNECRESIFDYFANK